MWGAEGFVVALLARQYFDSSTLSSDSDSLGASSADPRLEIIVLVPPMDGFQCMTKLFHLLCTNLVLVFISRRVNNQCSHSKGNKYKEHKISWRKSKASDQ